MSAGQWLNNPAEDNAAQLTRHVGPTLWYYAHGVINGVPTLGQLAVLTWSRLIAARGISQSVWQLFPQWC